MCDAGTTCAVMSLSPRYLAQVILLASVSSIDNFAVGISYSISGRGISHVSNGCIALANLAVSLATMLLGGLVAAYIDTDVASCLGALVFITLGALDLYTFARGICQSGDEAEAEAEAEAAVQAAKAGAANEETKQLLPSKPSSPPALRLKTTLDAKETMALALGLCFTNIASGIAAGLAGYSVWLFSLLVFMASFLLLLLGGFLGEQFGRHVPTRYVTLISGLALLGVGITNIPYLGL